MTKPKFPGGTQPIVVRPVSIEDRFITHLEHEVEFLRADVAFYRGKCERLELSIMNSDTKREAAIEFVERSDPAAPSIRNAKVDRPAEPGVYRTPFQKLKAEWDKMSPEQQRAAEGLAPIEPKPQQM